MAGTVAVVVGTRPEAIKMSEVIRLLGRAALVVHTGQHYSRDLWDAVTMDLGLPRTSVAGRVGGEPRCSQIGGAVIALGELFRTTSSLAAVVVHGDTNATLAGALAANAEGVPLVHVEAGLRSHDRAMPEEHNRRVVDHLADLCLAPTGTAVANLRAEGIAGARVRLTGNPIVEVVRRLLPDADRRRSICGRHGVLGGAFALATIHRPENTDDPVQLGAILADLRELARTVPVVVPLHPRTRAVTPERCLSGLTIVDPLPPRDFLALFAESALVISDSGGVQEEATVLQRPALVVRRSTERPEAIGRWCEMVQPGLRLRALAIERISGVGVWRRRCAAPSPYGDGSASRRIITALAALVDRDDRAVAA